MHSTSIFTDKNTFISFVWQHVLLLVSLFIMTFGVVLCVRSNLGSSVISSTPLVFTLAGCQAFVPPLTLGEYTNILNVILVIGQIIVLGKQFRPIQLLQVIVGLVFGFLIDLNMALTDTMSCDTLPMQLITQFAGCTIMAIGIAFEVRCGSVTMPGEGMPVAISRVSGMPFAKAKIMVDVTLVSLAVAGCFFFFGKWLWNVVGIGTLFAMVYVGFLVRVIDKRIGWFDRVLLYSPGCRRYIYGLARYLHSRND